MKWCRRSKFLEALWLVAALLPAWASAQPCCSTASALFPARLSAEEQAAFGVLVNAREEYGSLNGTGRFLASPRGDSEVGVEEHLLAAFAVSSRLQLAASVPVVETWRSASAYSQLGGGIGDIQLGARVAALEAGITNHVPGVAVLASVTAPTGVAADQAHQLLATDATGQGTWQLSGGAALEEWATDRLVFELTASVIGRLPRTAGHVRSQLAPQVFVGGSGGWLFDENRMLALSATFSREGDATVNGTPAPGSGRGLATLALFGALPLGDGFRLQGSIAADLPALGVGQSVGLQLTGILLKAW